MKFLTFSTANAPQGETRLGLHTDAGVLDLTALLGKSLSQAPRDVAQLIALGDAALAQVRELAPAAGRSGDQLLPHDQVRLLAPIPRPAKNVFCVGRNYKLHIIEGNRAAGRDPNDFPKAMEVFSKPWTTVIGPGAPVRRHANHTRILDYEIELAIVIGKEGVDIPRERALEHVFGYTIVNDVTARDLQKRHGQWFKGKSLDTTCPMGPWVVHRSAVPNVQDLRMQLEVNGETRQDANTSDMLFDVTAIIEQLSAGLTLHPGDVIATGTPSGVGFAMTPPRTLEAGDVMRLRIDGLGELVNPVVA
jgi:2-keto-4-pentenoate hydratase/2-oxohepta-3-ene-1,7-dioic acid hydratase in catechol pathway